MIVCPLCEHAQAQGDTCDGCGKILTVRVPVAVASAPIPDLEQTALPGANAPVPVTPIPDIEVTRAAPVQVPVQAIEVDRTRADAVPDMPVAPMPDMERTSAPDDGARTALPTGAMTCRYCRNVQAPGAFCDRCGMALPKMATPTTQAAAGPMKKRAQTVWTRCRKCGANAKGGERCGDCGQPVPMPES